MILQWIQVLIWGHCHEHYEAGQQHLANFASINEMLLLRHCLRHYEAGRQLVTFFTISGVMKLRHCHGHYESDQKHLPVSTYISRMQIVRHLCSVECCQIVSLFDIAARKSHTNVTESQLFSMCHILHTIT